MKSLGYKIFSPSYSYSSENYQIMNYGFGGSISLHLDASDQFSDNDIGDIEHSENDKIPYLIILTLIWLYIYYQGMYSFISQIYEKTIIQN